jgi:2-dehydro-3-deoxy-D-arabinonate dehydratase
MYLCRFEHQEHGARLGAIHEGQVYDISSRWSSLAELLRWSAGRSDLAAQIAAQIAGADPLATYDSATGRLGGGLRLLAPTDAQEVWAAGVTYERSRVAREEESAGSGIYERVYTAERPEIFLKATPSRTVGPNDAVVIRKDSQWNVPEPELGLVVNQALELVGFTVGNDMSSRDIEGENPLYLPQAKVYAGCCALGPVIALADSVADPTSVTISLTIERGGTPLFQDSTSTQRIVRSFSDLISYLGRDNVFPDGVVLLTGTGIVPPDEVTLEDGDQTIIAIDGIGELRNRVVRGAGG